jgi:hypothetical protein
MTSTPACTDPRSVERDRLNRVLNLKTLTPIAAELILTRSTLHSSADVQSIKVKQEYIKKKKSQWYYIAIFHTKSNTSRTCGLIADETLQLINKSRRTTDDWLIPLYLCTPYPAELLLPPAFNAYSSLTKSIPDVQDDKIIASIEKAFEYRSFLFNWFRCSEDLKDRRPLTNRQLLYATNVLSHKHIDNVIYHLLAHGIRRHPAAKAPWIRGEVNLLRFKLLVRPDLKKQIFGENCTYTLEQSINQLTAYHIHNLARIEALGMDPVPWLIERTDACLKKLINYEKVELLDKQAENYRSLQKNSGKDVIDFSIHSTEAIPIEDLMDCAPKCMQNCMSKAIRGTTKEQAALHTTQRRYMTHFLFENHYEADHIRDMQRPRMTIEYEMEEPTSSLQDIDEIINETEQKVDKAKSKGAEFFHTCSDIMKVGMCPFMDAAPQRKMTKEEYRANSKQRFITAKKQCHEKLESTWERRRMLDTSAGEKVKYFWTESPYIYTQVALRGEKANIYKTADIVAKRKKTIEAKEKEEQVKRAKLDDIKREAELQAESDKAKQQQQQTFETNRAANSDTFEVFNLPATSSMDDVKKAYKRLAMLHHPDKAAATGRNTDEAKARFQRIQNAYERLISK